MKVLLNDKHILLDAGYIKTNLTINDSAIWSHYGWTLSRDRISKCVQEWGVDRGGVSVCRTINALLPTYNHQDLPEGKLGHL